MSSTGRDPIFEISSAASTDPKSSPVRIHVPTKIAHGTADTEDLPLRTQDFYDDAVKAGIRMELHWCEGSGHNAPAGMPIVVCKAAFGGWVLRFFTHALAAS